MTVERRGHVLLIGLNRPAKRNAFNLALIDQLAAAYYQLEHDDDVRCGVLFAHGEHFTGGLDLAEVGPLIRENVLDFSAPGRRDPWRKDNVWTTPLVAAVQGWVMTLAIELLLAADIQIAACVRRRHHPAAARRRLGQRDAVASDGRRIRRRRGASHRTRPRSRRAGAAARTRDRDRRDDRDEVGAARR